VGGVLTDAGLAGVRGASNTFTDESTGAGHASIVNWEDWPDISDAAGGLSTKLFWAIALELASTHAGTRTAQKTTA
jgi:hypothetical protein